MPKLKAGTRPTADAYANLAYTQEQLTTLEQIRDPQYKLRVAKPEYVNKALHPDGTISDDISQLEMSLKEKALAARDRASTVPAMMEAARLLSEVDTIQDHVDQKRFLFVLDENGAPVIYFQCATPDNPDRETFNGG